MTDLKYSYWLICPRCKSPGKKKRVSVSAIGKTKVKNCFALMNSTGEKLHNFIKFLYTLVSLFRIKKLLDYDGLIRVCIFLFKFLILSMTMLFLV